MFEDFEMEYNHDFEVDVAADGYTPFADGIDDDLTGADIYRIMLSASFGGKTVHGANYVPSCEMVTKVSEEHAEKYIHGRITYANATNPPKAGVLPDEYQPGIDSDYLPIRSATHAVLAFDDDVFTTTSMVRAKNAAVCAALVEETAETPGDGKKFAEKITSGPVPDNLLEAVRIPASAARREVLLDAKPTHSIFSGYAHQTRILWHDANLSSDRYPENAAIDWGRVTNIARYIAEANIQTSPAFKEYASNRGVPYAIVRGAWAEVSDADTFIPTAVIDSITTFDCAKYNIPNVDLAYTQHANDMYARVAKIIKLSAIGEMPLAGEAILMELDKIRAKAIPLKHLAVKEPEILAGPVKHTITASRAAAMIEAGKTSKEVFYDVAARIVRQDPKLLRHAEAICHFLSVRFADESTVLNSVTVIGSRLLTMTTWAQVAGELKRRIDSTTAALERAANLRRAISSTSTAWGVEIGMTRSVRTSIKPYVYGTCKRAVLPAPSVPAFPPLLVSVKQDDKRDNIRTLLSNARYLLTEHKSLWAERYEAWARIYANNARPGSNDPWMAVCYGLAASAFRLVRPSDLLNRSGGYTSATDPERNYLYKAAQNYARKRKLDKPPAPNGRIAEEYAAALDTFYYPKIAFADCVDFVSGKLEMLAEDIVGGLVGASKLEESPPEVVEIKPDPAIAANTAGAETPAAAPSLNFLFDLFSGACTPVVSEESVRASYPDQLMPDEFARANGYSDFEAAFADLGQGAIYDEANSFTEKGLVARAKREQAPTDDDILAGN